MARCCRCSRLALPTVGVMFLVTLLSAAETYFVSSLGTDAIAAASLVVRVTPAARSSRSSVASWGFSGRRQLLDYKSNNAREV
jgi:hypothetical protein